MIDMHTHILPGIDDGSRDSKESYEIIKALSKNDIDTIVLTPHYYSYDKTIDEFIQDRETAWQRLKKYLDTQEAMNINFKLGAEVLLDIDLQYNEDIIKLAIEGTNYILLEMPYSIWDDWIYDAVQNIISKYDMRIIIPHIERYLEIHNDITYINNILQIPEVYAQLNIGDLINSKKKNISRKMLNKRYIYTLGTDIHRIEQIEMIQQSLQFLKSKYRNEQLEIFNTNSKQILHNEELQKLDIRYITMLFSRIYV